MIYSKEGTQINNAYTYQQSSAEYAFDKDGNVVYVASPSGLKVMSYNIGKFTGINSQQNMQSLIIDTYGADIIGIQELGNSSTIPAIGQNMLVNYPIMQVSNHKNYLLSVSKSLSFSNVVIQDYANQDPEDVSSYGETRAFVKVEFSYWGRTISFINTHLCHLTQSVKYLQMKELFDYAEQLDSVIITGDFNSYTVTAQSDEYINMYKQFVDAGYNLANNSPNSGYQNTFTSSSIASSLSELTTAPDTIIVSGDISIDSVVFDTTKFSYLNGNAIDHIPVIATLSNNN